MMVEEARKGRGASRVPVLGTLLGRSPPIGVCHRLCNVLRFKYFRFYMSTVAGWKWSISMLLGVLESLQRSVAKVPMLQEAFQAARIF